MIYFVLENKKVTKLLRTLLHVSLHPYYHDVRLTSKGDAVADQVLRYYESKRRRRNEGDKLREIDCRIYEVHKLNFLFIVVVRYISRKMKCITGEYWAGLCKLILTPCASLPSRSLARCFNRSIRSSLANGLM